MGMETRLRRRIDLLLIALLALAAGLVYANSLKNPFIWDQEVVIQGNPFIRSWNNLPQVFTTDMMGRPMRSSGFYRPLEVVSYMVEHSLWGLNPTGVHITSTALHLIVGVLIFFLIRRLWGKSDDGYATAAGFLTAFFFLIHPVNTEAVVYSVRGDLLATLFGLAVFLLYLKAREGSVGAAWAAAPLGLLAILAKESAVMQPFILGAHFLLVRREEGPASRAAKGILIFLLLAATGYTVFRLAWLGGGAHSALSSIAHASLIERLLTFPRILLTYLRLWVYPVDLHMEYLFVVRFHQDPWFAFGAPGLVLLGAGLGLYARRPLPFPPGADTARTRARALLFAAWVVLGLAPFYNILVTLHASLSEHWAYFPGVGFLALAVGVGLALFARFPAPAVRAGLILAALFVSAYFVRASIRRNAEWRDPWTLYTHDVSLEPDSFILHNNIGVLFHRRGDLENAKRAFQKAVRVSPNQAYDVAHNNLGVVYEAQGRADLAESAYRRSIMLNGYELAYANLSRLYLNHKRPDLAFGVAREGRKSYPSNPEIALYEALALSNAGRPEEAKAAFDALEKWAPGYLEERGLRRAGR